jgi:serralysin
MPTRNNYSSSLYGLQDENDARVAGLAPNRQATHFTNLTGNNLIDGVTSGYVWSGGKITYAFPDNKSDYHYSGEKNHGFDNVSSKIEGAAKFILDAGYRGHANDGFSVEGFTKLHVSEGSDTSATIRYAESSSANPTAYAYYPGSGSVAGDVWFGHNYDYSNAVQGNYEFATVIHETGHALGLKHGHEASTSNTTYPALNYNYDSLEYSVMTYKSFVGDSATSYKNEHWGYPQTYMMADIAALQNMYGANFSVNDESTHYKWKPGHGETWVNGQVGLDPGGNRIFATIWDGGGKHDSYDLSAYKNSVNIDLGAGGYSKFSNAQVADLGAASFAGPGQHMASGNIYNALMYKGNTASLIEDAIGGGGNDKLSGNKIGNHLEGRGGDDRFYGMAGNDIYEGNAGADTFFFKAGWDKDRIADFGNIDTINLASFNFASVSDVLSYAQNDGKDVVFNFGNGDTLRLEQVHKIDLHNNDFII